MTADQQKGGDALGTVIQRYGLVGRVVARKKGQFVIEGLNGIKKKFQLNDLMAVMARG